MVKRRMARRRTASLWIVALIWAATAATTEPPSSALRFVAAATPSGSHLQTRQRPGDNSNDDDCIVVVTWEEEIPGGTTSGGRKDVRGVAPSVNKKNNTKVWKQLRDWFSSPMGDESTRQAGASRGTIGSTTDDNDQPHHSLQDRISEAASSALSRSRVLQDDPHPLRTDEWQLQLRWKKRRFVFEHPPTLLLDFHPTGYVRCRRLVGSSSDSYDKRHDDGASHTQDNTGLRTSHAYGSIGTWELTPTGLSWTLGLDDDVDDDSGDGTTRHKSAPDAVASRRAHKNAGTGVYWFHADLHLNPFGPHPRLSRGVVLHDKGSDSGSGSGDGSSVRWFRPVVATFSGVGTGRDTVDLSYRRRGRK